MNENNTEVVAWLYTSKLGGRQVSLLSPPPDLKDQYQPLYTAPPQKEWICLTDEEIADCVSGIFAERNYWVKFTRAIEAKLKEKNHAD